MDTNQNNLKENKLLDLKKLSNDRTERAYSILQKGKPTMINEQEFLVPASNPEYKYKVTHIDSWTCECPDFKKRCKDNGLYCKHIKAIQFFMKLKNKTEIDDLTTKNIKEECVYCNEGFFLFIFYSPVFSKILFL